LINRLVGEAAQQKLKPWRRYLSRLATILILGFLLYWSWRNRQLLFGTFASIGIINLAILASLLFFALILSVLAFTVLVRSMGYSFTLRDSYHSLNLSQVAAMVPGKIWGFAGLAALLVSRGVTRQDSILIITLNMLIMLSGCILVGAGALAAIIGWPYTLFCLIPLLFLFVGRDWLDGLRLHYLNGSSPLPSSTILMKLLLIAVLNWLIVALAFAWLVYTDVGSWPASPFLVAGALPAGYVAGFLALITPSGLGVSEGVVTLILESSVGLDKALALAIAFRIIHTVLLWFNIAITLLALSFNSWKPGPETDDLMVEVDGS
jgi:glycosyltransferase 2 family protein